MAAPVRDFKGTQDGEWDTTGGDFSTLSGVDAVPQGARIRVGMFLSECYLDESIGIDYIDQILVKDPDPLVVRAMYQIALLDTPDVTNAVGSQLLKEDGTRDASINFLLDTIYSEDPLSVQVGVP